MEIELYLNIALDKVLRKTKAKGVILSWDRDRKSANKFGGFDAKCQ